jgi:hypothetical protein
MSTNSDERLKKSFGDGRQNRAMEDRAVTEDRVLSDDERVEMFQHALFAEVLPSLPPIKGYRTIWLTTTNQTDIIPRRMALGYEPVKPEDVPGWGGSPLKSGEYSGFIGVNEMLAFKIREELWFRFMAEAHHHAPNREAEKLTSAIDGLKDNARRLGGRLVEAKDQEENLRGATLKPKFT